MSATILTKTERVLELEAADDILGGAYENEGWVYFAQRAEDDPMQLSCGVDLHRRDWLDMGCPVKVTITVSPGDLLNQD